MDRYPPIADHGLVGDLQTVALISSRGVVDWLAAPRFDSPSVFAALLDHERGGFFRVAPEGGTHTCKQLYYPDTAVVVTRFMAPEGVGEVLDWMTPIRSGGPTRPAHPRPHRTVGTRHRALRPGVCGPGSTTAVPPTPWNSPRQDTERSSARRTSPPTSGRASP